MLWELEIRPHADRLDREAEETLDRTRRLGIDAITELGSARVFLLETDADRVTIERDAVPLLVDSVVETWSLTELPDRRKANGRAVLTVLFKPGVTDNTGNSAKKALESLGVTASAVGTGRRYFIDGAVTDQERTRFATRVLANDAIEYVAEGPLTLSQISLGGDYTFEKVTVPIRTMDDDALETLSKQGQLYLSLEEMRTIRDHFRSLDRDPTDVELETVAQTWSEHCSHKTLAGRIAYRDGDGETRFENMLKETIFAATQTVRRELGEDDWCVSVFEDNAGIVRFDETRNVCIKVETHNHPSALEPYGGANTGLGGVIRDPLGTGLGARPVCNTDVFCFAPPETSPDDLPPGVLHPRAVAEGVVAGVRDYGNRMGIPTVNGAVYFDERYLGNPLVYCGNVAMIPRDKCDKTVSPGELIVAVGGRTGRDGIHGATFSSAELTEESETLSGGAVQIGNPVTEKMVADVILEARDRGLYRAITDCGAGGFSSAVGEMGEQTGAVVHLERAPLKYAGLSYTEIWISEAQERMVLSVPPENRDELLSLCESEGVEATVIGEFTDTGRLELFYDGESVADLSMHFLHDGRPPIVREAVYQPEAETESKWSSDTSLDCERTLLDLLGSPNIASKRWIIRQYDHEVQAGSVVKPLVGPRQDGPSDAAVVRPELDSDRGLVIGCGMNPRFGDFDPYWMAAGAIDEAVRNVVAVGADPDRIAILDNFCWGNTDRPETLGSLVRAALACRDFAVAYRTPFVSGKDSLFNEFSYRDGNGDTRTVAIPASLLITALGQIEDVRHAVTMDLKRAGNALVIVGETADELGGSHLSLVTGSGGGRVPRVNAELAPEIFRAIHAAIVAGTVRSCHDLSEGGLAVAAAEMAFAGELGVAIDLSNVPTPSPLSSVVRLFSESPTRFFLEVPEEQLDRFGELLGDLPHAQIGIVSDDRRMTVMDGSQPMIDLDIEVLRERFNGTFADG